MTAADRETGVDNREGGGFSAELAPRPAPSVRVGPTTEGRHNTLRAGIIPIACWRLEDIHFEFDSSFLRPDVGPGMTKLARLVADHPGSPLSVFGHADPVGRDDYNKKLSGRRAAAIYGLLTRNAEIWEDIHRNTGRFSAALPTDEWGVRAVQVMLQALGYDPGGIDGRIGDGTRSAVRHFQEDRRDQGLRVDGDPGPATREKLFLAYMDRICTDENGEPFRLDAAAFLAGGVDPGGRGDYQGCGEFNPLLLFSRAESERLAAARDERDRENAPNRRVMILLFRPGSRIRPDRWPCPRAAEGGERCRRRLFSDAETRRAFQDGRRLFEESHDTFACRFYHHLTSDSPCERASRHMQVHWLTTLPEYDAGDIALIVRDERGAKLQHIPLGCAKPGPGAYRSFDLSDLNPDTLCFLELHRGERAVSPIVRLNIGALCLKLADGNASGTEEDLTLAASQASPSRPLRSIEPVEEPLDEPFDEIPPVVAGDVGRLNNG